MLKKELRLDPKEIPLIARRGKRLYSELFELKVWWDDSLISPQFALAVGLKVSKKAVVRNNIKRKFRAAIHHLTNENRFKKGKYLIVAKSDKLSELSGNDIEKSLSDSLNSN